MLSMSRTPPYQKVSESYVAVSPSPDSPGVVELYGGYGFGHFPLASYGWLLDAVYAAGYSLIVVPYSGGFDHWKTAGRLLREREAVLGAVPELRGMPHWWLGHSLGCKLILLLDAATTEANEFQPPDGAGADAFRGLRGVRDDRVVLMAPDISGTSAAIPVRWLAWLLDLLGLGVRPTPAQTYALLERTGVFRRAGVMAFTGDTISGTRESDPPLTVARLCRILSSRRMERLEYAEQPGAHLQPCGGRALFLSFGPALRVPGDPAAARPVQEGVVSLLAALAHPAPADPPPGGNPAQLISPPLHAEVPMTPITLTPEEQAFQDALTPADTTGLTGLPVVSQFEVLLAPIFPQGPAAEEPGAASARRVDPRRFPSPFRHLAEARDDGRGRTAGRLAAAGAQVPRPEVLQGLFVLITNPTPTPATVIVILEVNTLADVKSIVNDTLAFDLRTGAPVVGAWIPDSAGRTFAYYVLSTPLAPGQTTNVACIPNFLKDPAPVVSVRGIVSTRTDVPALYFTPEQRAVFYPTDGSDVFSTVAYCLTTRTGSNLFSFR